MTEPADATRVNLHQLFRAMVREGGERHAHHHRLAPALAHRRRDPPLKLAPLGAAETSSFAIRF